MIIDLAVLPLFLMSALLIMLTPGADMVFIIANSVSAGKRQGFIAALGIASGATIHFVAAALARTIHEITKSFRVPFACSESCSVGNTVRIALLPRIRYRQRVR